MVKARLQQAFFMFLASFLGLGLFVALDAYVKLGAGLPLLIGSFGATSAILYAMPDRDISQFKNVVGGHFLSAIVGVFCGEFIAPIDYELAMVAAVSLSIFVMALTYTMHPPGAAAGLLAVMMPEVPALVYVFVTAGLGVVVFYYISFFLRKILKYPTYGSVVYMSKDNLIKEEAIKEKPLNSLAE